METRFQIKHKVFTKQRVSKKFTLAKTRFSVEKHEDESGVWREICTDSITVAWVQAITVAMEANSHRFQSLAKENEDRSKSAKPSACLEQKVQKVFQTCQTCRFRNREVN